MELKDILRKARNYTLVIVVFVVIFLAFSFYHNENKNIVPYNEYPEGSVLVAKNTYVYPYKIIIAIYKDGTVKKYKIVDEVTDMGAPKEQYRNVNELSKDEIKTLERLIADCEAHRTTLLDIEYYGLLIKTSHESTLESASHFEQEYVDRLNEFIENIKT